MNTTINGKEYIVFISVSICSTFVNSFPLDDALSQSSLSSNLLFLEITLPCNVHYFCSFLLLELFFAIPTIFVPHFPLDNSFCNLHYFWSFFLSELFYETSTISVPPSPWDTAWDPPPWTPPPPPPWPWAWWGRSHRRAAPRSVPRWPAPSSHVWVCRSRAPRRACSPRAAPPRDRKGYYRAFRLVVKKPCYWLKWIT